MSPPTDTLSATTSADTTAVPNATATATSAGPNAGTNATSGSTSTTANISTTTTTTTTNVDHQGPSTLAAVAVKLPQFWKQDPHIWFLQVEEQFKKARITTETAKYSYLMTSLPPNIAMDVRDILVCPPSSPYTALKTAILKRTAVSQKENLQQLLQAEVLGDRTPSQLLRSMTFLHGTAPTNVPLFREIFLSRLPTTCQQFLAMMPDSTPLDELAEAADRVLSYTPAVLAPVAAVSTPTAHVPPTPVLPPTPMPCPVVASETAMIAAIERLTEQVAELKTERKEDYRRHRSPPRWRHRPPPRWCNRSRSREYPPTRSNGVCYYHTEFGSRARKCREPCSYYHQGNGQAGRQ